MAAWNAFKTAEEAKDVDFKDYGNCCDEEPEHRHERAGNPERRVWNEEEVRSKQCGAVRKLFTAGAVGSSQVKSRSEQPLQSLKGNGGGLRTTPPPSVSTAHELTFFKP